MTAPHIVDPARLLDQAVGDASPDLIRHLLGTVINALCSAEADAVCGAEYGMPSPDRMNQTFGAQRPQSQDTKHTAHNAWTSSANMGLSRWAHFVGQQLGAVAGRL